MAAPNKKQQDGKTPKEAVVDAEASRLRHEDDTRGRRASEVQLLVRMDQGLRNWFKDEVGKIDDLTEKDAITNILSSLRTSNNPELVKRVLRGNAAPEGNEIKTQYSRAVQRIGYGEHAFTRGFYSWAYEEFTRLLNITSENDYDLQALGHFKAAYCLLEISYGIRHEILDKLRDRNDRVLLQEMAAWRSIEAGEKGRDTHSTGSTMWGTYYRAAEHCVSMALWRYRQVETLGGEHPVCFYNRACAWSLKCQLTVERELGPTTDMVDVARAHSDENTLMHPQKPWKSLGERWRDNIPDPRKRDVVEEVSRYSANCLNQLKALTDYDKDVIRDKNLYDIVFLYKLAHKDTDLDFIRFDLKTREKMEEFLSNYDSERSTLNSFYKINDRLPSFLQQKPGNDIEKLIS